MDGPCRFPLPIRIQLYTSYSHVIMTLLPRLNENRPAYYAYAYCYSNMHMHTGYTVQVPFEHVCTYVCNVIQYHYACMHLWHAKISSLQLYSGIIVKLLSLLVLSIEYSNSQVLKHKHKDSYSVSHLLLVNLDF